jgi:hypothetical protein
MVASYSSAPPRLWRPTARTLAASFAGSAVMFTFAVLNGGSLLSTANEAWSIAEPVGAPAITGPGHGGVNLAPGQAIQWTPGAASQSGSSVEDLSVSQAPALEGLDAPASGAPAEIASAKTAGSGSSADTMQAGDHPDTRSVGSGGRTQTAESRYGAPFHGLLSGVLQVTKRLALTRQLAG